MRQIEFDDGDWPLLVIRMEGKPTDPEFQIYLDTVQRYVDRGERYGLVISTSQGMPISSPAHLKLQAAWTRDNAEAIGERCAGIAFVLPSPAMRGVLRAALSLQKLPVQHEVFRDESEGLEWVRSQLAVTKLHQHSPA